MDPIPLPQQDQPALTPDADPLEAAAARWLAGRRGKPLRPTGTPLARMIDAVAPPQKGREAPRIGDLQARWREIVGDKLAAVSQPDAVRAGTLTLRVASAAAPLLTMRSKEILGLLALSGRGDVKRLSFVRAPLKHSHASSGSARRPAMLDAIQRRAIEAELAGVQHPALRAALLRLAETTADMA